MPRITVLAHESLCPQGAEFLADAGAVLCRELLDHGIAIEHACELSCACTTCHVIVRKGFESLDPSEEEEDDMLDKAWRLSAGRLSCQVRLDSADLVVEIPQYTISHAREDH